MNSYGLGVREIVMDLGFKGFVVWLIKDARRLASDTWYEKLEK